MPRKITNPDAVAMIYARTLVDMAFSAGGQPLVEEVQGDLEDILELARQMPQFGEFLSSRVLAAGARSASLDRILQGRANDLTVRFLHILNEKGRLGHLAVIAAALDQLVQEKFGRVEVDVFTAEPVSPNALADIRRRLSDALRKEVVAHPYVDGSMLGGVRFRVGDQLIDASVATRLRRMREQMAEQGAAKLRARMGDVLGG